MTLEERLTQAMYTAMKEKNQDVVDAIKMVKTKIAEKRTSPGFQGEVTDKVVQDVIASYCRSLQKAIEEFEAGGKKDHPLVDKYRFEINYLSSYLPKKLSEGETRALVEATIKELSAISAKDRGRVIGSIMKTRKDEVDGALVKRLVEEMLK